MTRAADPLTAQVISLFARVTERYTREYEAAAAQHGLTPQQVKALLALDEQPLPMRRVAERLGAQPSNLTSVIDRLQSRGLVERHADPDDRRVKLLATTETGASAARELRERLRFARDPLIALTQDQRRDLRDLLELIMGS
ncbi:MarR family winged helix-turn-helix transcriptional regulator [Streptomyces sp. NPDC086835]|jgi:DNA-binding MarR family transcriptional regulator|uniref:MarR family winged helix-turn-helix transcriptional regulator n=1 Tax=Streptomyces sp. NPDC086835 TaxID=3365761 RepID=UPI0038186CAF